MINTKTLKGKLLIILGPTASGKTDLAVKLAKKFNSEIINADSRQIYEGMDIGTAKGKIQNSKLKSQKNHINGQYSIDRVPIHLINIAKPTKIITAAQYKKLAEKKIDEIFKRRKLPILCGGTMLYLDMIAKNYQIPKKPPSSKVREGFAKKDLESLLKELKENDEAAWEMVDKKNRRRVERALELAMAGKSIIEAKKSKPKYDILKIGIQRTREELYERINKRVPEMIGEGLVNETEQILKRYGRKVISETIGYKEVLDWIRKGKKNEDLGVTIGKIQLNTRHYAKRQLTWWRKDQEIRWVKDFAKSKGVARKFLS